MARDCRYGQRASPVLSDQPPRSREERQSASAQVRSLCGGAVVAISYVTSTCVLRTQAPCWRHVLVNFFADLFHMQTCFMAQACSGEHHQHRPTTDVHLLLSAFDVAVCIAGYGQQGVSTDCTPCDYGSYHPGGGIRCTQCPAARFYAPVDGAGDIWESQGVWCLGGGEGGGGGRRCLVVYREEGDGQAAASPSGPCRRVPCAALMVQATCRAMPCREDSL
jgi:hypothetical protein